MSKVSISSLHRPWSKKESIKPSKIRIEDRVNYISKYVEVDEKTRRKLESTLRTGDWERVKKIVYALNLK